MASLLIANGPQRGTCYRLQARPIIAGRDPVNEIQLLDTKVSRRHFMVVPKGSGFAVRELRSTNGIKVNGEAVTGDRPLGEGDVIRVGSTEILFSDSDHPDLDDALRRYRKFEKPLRERSTERE